MKYLKQFETHAEYEAAKSSLIRPNVSICKDTPNEVHYNPLVSVTCVTLNTSTLSLNKGETETLVATVLPSDASNKSVTWSSSNSSVATVSNNGLVTAVGDSGNANITVTTVDGGHTAQCAFNIIDPYGGHDYVEIGGLKWATMNIGASQPSDYGLYFAWGDTQGYTAEQVGSGEGQKYFGWADYKYGNGTSSPDATGMTKYNATDGLTTLEAVDDAAVANWGGSWRMPTTAEFQALGAAVNTAWTQVNNVYGILCTDKTDSSKTLFFPAAGGCHKGSVKDVGRSGSYWSSSLKANSRRFAYCLFFDSIDAHWDIDVSRDYGYAVRPVVG